MGIEKYLNDDNAMKNVAVGFSQRSKDILRGAICTINVWLVDITRPYTIRDKVPNPAS